MSVQIVTGYTGERHITPYMDATVNRGIFGEDGCILSSGSQMSASMPDINTFVIADGAFSIQGHIGITNGETLTIDTCASGSRRIDLVVARFTHDSTTNVDAMSIVLLKGTETTSAYPTTPTYNTGSIADGANVDLLLYKITLSGSTVTFSRTTQIDNPLSNIMNAVYPVGSIYMSVNNVNPANLFGGTWVAWGSGRVPVGVNSNDGNFNTVEKTGGAKAISYKPTGSNTGTAISVAQMPSHQHRVVKWNKGGTGTAQNVGWYDSDASSGSRWQVLSGSDGKQKYDCGTTATGSGQAHTHTFNGTQVTLNTMSPYITCYMWKRTA